MWGGCRWRLSSVVSMEFDPSVVDVKNNQTGSADESLSQNLIENVKLDVDLHVVSHVYKWNERSNGDLVFA